MAGCDRLIAHRAVCAGSDGHPPCSLREILWMDRFSRTGLFSSPGYAGAARFSRGAHHHVGILQHARATAGSRARAGVQMRRPLVDARRNSSRLLQGRAVSSRPISGEFRRSRDSRSLLKMAATTISDLARPSLAQGVRLQIDSTTGKNVLLYPEGIV